MSQTETYSLNPLVPKSSSKFSCSICDYFTCRQSQYDRHLLTSKHKQNAEGCIKSSKIYTCKCGNIYTYRQGLQKHKRTCNETSPTTESPIDNNFLTNLVLEVIKNNNELQHKYIELQKQNNDFQQKMMESFQEVLKNGIHNISKEVIVDK